MTSVALQSHPQDWAYLSEGGSTIVFSYTGPIHPSFTGKVLRLRKTSLDPSANRTTTTEEEEQDDLVVAFHNTVIAVLVPRRFLPDLVVVLLDPQWLAALELLRDGDRPPERRAKDRIDKNRQKGILATDLIGGAGVLAVEIKPKWGFLPNPTHLSQETVEIKTSTCRFCMHTHLKYKVGGSPTQYCPLDLYSNDEARIRKALRDLWDGWLRSDGALNNMRIFVSGKIVKPFESCAPLEEFFAVKTEAHEALATALLPLLQAPALGIISNLQRSLDALDIEGVARLHANTLGAIRDNPLLEELQAFTSSYRSIYCALDHSKLSPEHADTYLIAYLLAATFKDCSVIYRLCRSDLCGTSSVDSPRAISIIDLDLKGVDRFEQWADLDRRIVECYREVARRKSCVE